MAEEVKDKWTRLVNPDGVEEDVWDFPGHVDKMPGSTHWGIADVFLYRWLIFWPPS